MSGTFITIDAKATARLIGAGDIDENDTTMVTPRNDVLVSDFQDLWWIGDYSDVNNDNADADGKAGFVAIHMLNALSTGGFQIQSGNREKGQFEFEFTGHYSIDAQDTVPFVVYVSAGTAESGSSKASVPDNSGNLDGFLPSGASVNISDLMDKDVKVNWQGIDGTVVGTFPHKASFTEFSNDAAEQEGHYFVIELDEKFEGKPITVTGTKTKTETDRKWVLRIDGAVEEGKKFKFDTDGTPIITLDFSKATLNPSD